MSIQDKALRQKIENQGGIKIQDIRDRIRYLKIMRDQVKIKCNKITKEIEALKRFIILTEKE